MIVHFPIALMFVAFLVDLLAFWLQDLVLERAGFLLLVLAWLSLGAALLAGWVAEHEVVVAPASLALLEAHARDGILTGILTTATLLLRWRARTRWQGQAPMKTVSLAAPRRPMQGPTRRAWSLTGISYLAALAMVSITGSLGGSLVYDHGVGIAAHPTPLAAGNPPASHARTPAASPASQAVAAGAATWANTCSVCHGSPPPFTSSLVAQVGAGALKAFIAQNMPPGNPVSPQQASDLVQYFQTLK